ncbi:TPA: IncI1-type relaxosome accessory protein NikA [Escherichia coli]|uniref:IncI1-type relaxosome accessory protein NikA n=1 Tax=Escherichia coli TaxID=562 RepID=UPI000D6A6355|nr:IncI1-type relaxosome accessory protein NikA [Escherichia coli]EBD3559688.1 nikA protein [Salmonella enterica]ELZ4842238.1 IncI1-type relaxosome accessory protein NikA [Salmonella enterica]HBC6680409.1 IncI1-type relaxosome accessory protein NikA [Escherichia coli]HBN1856690.1 IncI1-type relaxosome accessory protein NikA [Escherichia coli]HBN2120095.1 IncI1-type relaxosome accessory protein NikA [Escherichia coli]
MSDSAVRKKSEVRQKTVVRTLRFSPVEDEIIRKKAEDSGLTVSAYIRNAALNKRINSRTDDVFLKELMRLGRMQKHLFVQGKRTGDKEYAEVLVAITELTNTLRKQLMEG